MWVTVAIHGLLLASVMASEQVPFGRQGLWKVELDSVWDLLGPFPIHAREHHLLSPAFPLNLSHPIDYNRSWPSSYADGGLVRWSQVTSSRHGDIEISFPHVRWKALRSTEGWAALQHHAVIRTTLTLHPPSNPGSVDRTPRIHVHLKQGSFFALRPQGVDHSSFIPVWYPGNIYDLERALPLLIDLPVFPSLTEPTKYEIFVSADYELRLFGDPLVHQKDIPVQKLSIQIDIQEVQQFLSFVHQPSQDIVPDFWGGYAFGYAMGIGIQSITKWWTATDIKLKIDNPSIRLRLLYQVRIAPSQMRVVPIVIEQTSPFRGELLEFEISLRAGEEYEILFASIPIKHQSLQIGERQAIKCSFFLAGSSPSAFMAKPPTTITSTQHPPIIALHGAGVDVLSQSFWSESLPNNKFSWLIVASGRTSWGLDWHGPSARDVWESLDALTTLLEKAVYGFSGSWGLARNTRVLMMGHSNGGQGTWYLSSRFPDRILGAIPAAAYIKSQAYVPLTMARSGHFIDPVLRSILESALTSDDNDLHISNLVDTPILAIHGGDDENVPVWHSREAFATLKSWSPSANISFREDPGQGHWYPNVLNNSEVQDFVDDVTYSSRISIPSQSFTLTVTAPQDCGSLHGWRINQVTIPGRFGRLQVTWVDDSKVIVEPSNILSFTVPQSHGPFEFSVESVSGKWEMRKPQPSMTSQPPGRIQSILSSPGPITIITSRKSSGNDHSAALRLAYVLQLYHRLDSEIIAEDEAHTRTAGTWPTGNIIFIGPPRSPFATDILGQRRTSARTINHDSTIHFGTRKFQKPGQALMFSHPHPTQNNSLMLFILYNDDSGLERAVRVFPFRTGVAVPDCVIVGAMMDTLGAAGIEGAGCVGQRLAVKRGHDLVSPLTRFSKRGP
ncbi:hypothetical protein M413DRAFT_92377 [Hebeloma cylindrosporum]|uniref:Peptidase S9 prolyl oligopeptidase catalytic domain-containing protein n=1 Tax=Hebeloma cylindrosporum TaxID=76867 RepID=A0A0C2Z774_HEBCY|nr:hypothetical protein M413DRAFT_92377 [Hebeloma cylindrosporum h7]